MFTFAAYRAYQNRQLKRTDAKKCQEALEYWNLKSNTSHAFSYYGHATEQANHSKSCPVRIHDFWIDGEYREGNQATTESNEAGQVVKEEDETIGSLQHRHTHESNESISSEQSETSQTSETSKSDRQVRFKTEIEYIPEDLSSIVIDGQAGSESEEDRPQAMSWSMVW